MLTYVWLQCVIVCNADVHGTLKRRCFLQYTEKWILLASMHCENPCLSMYVNWKICCQKYFCLSLKQIMHTELNLQAVNNEWCTSLKIVFLLLVWFYKVFANAKFSLQKIYKTKLSQFTVCLTVYCFVCVWKLTYISGMSETSGPGTMSTPIIPDSYKIGSVGKPFIGMEVRLDLSDSANGEGEVGFCFPGAHLWSLELTDSLTSVREYYFTYTCTCTATAARTLKSRLHTVHVSPDICFKISQPKLLTANDKLISITFYSMYQSAME